MSKDHRKTYLNDFPGIYIKSHSDWVYIGVDNGDGDKQETIIMTDELDAVIDALKRIRADVTKAQQAAVEREKLAAWNAKVGRR